MVILSIKGVYDIETGSYGSLKGIRASVEEATICWVVSRLSRSFNLRGAIPSSPRDLG